MSIKTVAEAIQYRRSIRVYDSEKPIDSEVVKKCLKLATLAPTSSNMQLWEFYHITHEETLKKMVPLCFHQNAAKTAQQMVVFVTRKDLWKTRAKANSEMLNNVFPKRPKSEWSNREKTSKNYYKKLIPFVYKDFWGLLGLLKYMMVVIGGIFKPMYREVRAKDMRVVVHKTCGLAAQTFMLAMAAEGYDTCPMEGSDTWRVKKLLDLPRGSEINMIVSCGVRKPEGVYGERFRIPFTEVYRER